MSLLARSCVLFVWSERNEMEAVVSKALRRRFEKVADTAGDGHRPSRLGCHLSHTTIDRRHIIIPFIIYRVEVPGSRQHTRRSLFLTRKALRRAVELMSRVRKPGTVVGLACYKCTRVGFQIEIRTEKRVSDPSRIMLSTCVRTKTW